MTEDNDKRGPPPAPPKEGSVGNNLLRDNLKTFLINRGIAHSTPLPMGEGSGVRLLGLSNRNWFWCRKESEK